MSRVLYRGEKCVTGQGTELATESVGNLWGTEKSLAPAGRLAHKLVTALSYHRSSDPSNTFADLFTRLKGAKFQNTVIFTVYFHILSPFKMQENRI